VNALGVINLFVYIGLAPLAFAFLRKPRYVMLIVAGGWLTLSPRAGMSISGLPELTKDFAVSYGLTLGLLLFRSELLQRYRFHALDLFAMLWLIAPAISSLSNGLGAWDAASEFYGQVFRWGMPYFVGRVLIGSLDDVRECAIGILLAGLVAAPLCLIEIRLSPQLHRWTYGVHQAPFHMTARLGGYRPMLMFRHGIEVGSWMACATAIAAWFAFTGPTRRLLSVPQIAIAAGMFVVSLMCRSLGALALLFGTMAAATVFRTSRIKVALVALILLSPVYIGARVTGAWSPEVVADFVESNIDAKRAHSLRGRIIQEQELGDHAGDRPFFGWGGHNRFRVFDDQGEATTAVDALWLLAYGKNGITGLIGLYGMLCLPSLLIVLRTPPRLLVHANMAGAMGIVLALTISTLDSLQNAFFSPLLMIGAGALGTTAISLKRWLPTPNRPHTVTRSNNDPRGLNRADPQPETV